MRSTPIVEIIRKYGLNSKRLNPKNRIKYEDAVKLVKQYDSSDLRIDDVIDNTRKNSHNHCHCGIPGCGQKIRYEYILVPKGDYEGTDKEIVAGSTCVWPTLGMSELTKKEFLKLDSVIRNHYELLDWMDNNKDVVEKLNKLKENEVFAFRAFWQEIESSPLLKEDTEYIRNLDIDKELDRVMFNKVLSKISDDEHKKIMSYMDELESYYSDNNFVLNICRRVKHYPYFKVTGNQFRWIKVSINRMWYDKNIKGTANDLYDTCESVMQPILDRFGYNGRCDFDAIKGIDEYVNNTDKSMKYAWVAYKCKNAVISV